jgi:hypothetical protein
MRQTRLLVVAVALALATSACGAVTPTTPSPLPTPGPSPTPAPTPTTRGTPWSELPPLSAEAKDFIVNYNLNKAYPGGEIGAVRRWDSFPIPIYASPDFRAQDLVAAVNLWQEATAGKITFQIVADPASAGIVLDMQWPPPGVSGPIPEESCGSEGPRRFSGNTIIFGGGNYAFKDKPRCAGNGDNRTGLAHGIGHILGLGGHTPSAFDLMGSPQSTWVVSPLLREIINWLYSVPPGTRPE